jgi:glycosyltransferase involved in cell wall biosynthesis
VKIALVHDWLTGMRGGEKVLLELVRLLPKADLFTLLWRRGSVSPEIEERVQGTSWLQGLPARAYRYYLPVFPAAIGSFDLAAYDLVISSSHAVAHAARAPRKHISYVHTPMRYLWDAREDYFRFGRGAWWKRKALAALAPWLREFDRRAAARLHHVIANSRHVQERIRRVWGRDAEVIYPPVDTDFFTPGGEPEDYYLVVSSLEPYKRIDLAVDAFSGGPRRLLVAGKGTLERELRRLARAPVEFLGEVSDAVLRDLYRRARALIFPGREDFGMTPVEAQACGCPVVCYGEGGVLESVVEGITGVYFAPQTAEALRQAVERAERMEWDSEALRRQSLCFSRQVFQDRMKAFLDEHGR